MEKGIWAHAPSSTSRGPQFDMEPNSIRPTSSPSNLLQCAFYGVICVCSLYLKQIKRKLQMEDLTGMELCCCFACQFFLTKRLNTFWFKEKKKQKFLSRMSFLLIALGTSATASKATVCYIQQNIRYSIKHHVKTNILKNRHSCTLKTIYSKMNRIYSNLNR